MLSESGGMQGLIRLQVHDADVVAMLSKRIILAS